MVKENHSKNPSVTLEELKTLIMVLTKKVVGNTARLEEINKKVDENYKELKERDLKFSKEFSRNIKEIGETHIYIFDQLDKLDKKLTKKIDNMNNLLETSIENLMQGNRERFFMKAHLEGNDKRITKLERKTNSKKAGKYSE